MSTDQIKGAAVEVAQDWLMGQTITVWLLSHPVRGLGVVILSIVLLWSLVRAITQFIERLWVILLRSPLRIGRWLFHKGLKWGKDKPPGMISSEQSSAPQLNKIVEQLERLQQEQQALLLELKTFLNQP